MKDTDAFVACVRGLFFERPDTPESNVTDMVQGLYLIEVGHPLTVPDDEILQQWRRYHQTFIPTFDRISVPEPPDCLVEWVTGLESYSGREGRSVVARLQSLDGHAVYTSAR